MDSALNRTAGGAHGLPGRDLKFHTAEWLEQFMHGRAQIPGGHGIFIKRCAQDVADFLFHGAAENGRSDAQPPLQSFIQVANSDTGHHAMSIGTVSLILVRGLGQRQTCCAEGSVSGAAGQGTGPATAKVHVRINEIATVPGPAATKVGVCLHPWNGNPSPNRAVKPMRSLGSTPAGINARPMRTTPAARFRVR